MPIQDTATPVRAVALGEQARGALLSAIVEGDLQPGEPLREAPLAQALGISRTPLREAVHRLAEIDLVRADPGRGYRVTPLEPARLGEIFEVAGALVGMAAGLALPRLTEEQMSWLEAVEGHVLTFDATIPGTHPYGPHMVDLFIDQCGNGVLREAVAGYRPHLLRLVRLYGASITRRAMARRASGVVAALRANDAHLVDASVRSYYVQAGRGLIEVLEQSRTGSGS